LPYVVDLHWFEWADESPQGRFDGEDQDYGLVDIQDRPYALLTDAHRQLNAAAQSTHAASALPLPTVFQRPPAPRLHESSPPRPFSGPLSFFAPGRQTQIVPWGDAPQGGVTRVESLPEAAVLHFESGGGWGTGVSFAPVTAPFDASGADTVELELQIPSGRTVQVFLSEMGVAAPGLAAYAGRAGSDGESYEFPALTGTGKLEKYTVSLVELERRTSWGNQRGNQELDLQALSAVDLDIPGKQGSGDVRVTSIVFKRQRSLVVANDDQR